MAEAEQQQPGGQQAAPPATPASTTERIEQLKQLGELKSSGVLTDAEFEQEKARILGG
ncbi:MAG: hypothetical protein JJLCMIEE_03648 [Acidimicrobiales bacterium]|nr:hypothetical protein [Acidimicrobiales bacterium]